MTVIIRNAFVLTFGLTSFTSHAINEFAEETLKFPLKGLKAIELDTTSGNATIDGVLKSSEIVVKVQKKVFENGCTFTNTQRAGKLELIVRKNASARCEVHFVISTPPALAAEVTTGSGDIIVKGVHGDLELDTGSGDIRVEGGAGKIESKTGSGNIVVTGLRSSEAEFHTGAGDIDLTYLAVPQAGDLEIKSGSGDVKVAVPAGSKFTTQVSIGSGKFTNEVGDTHKATFHIEGQLGSGSMTIRKL